MIDAQAEPIPEPGDDAYKDGALSRKHYGLVVKRVNRPITLSLPPEAAGKGSVKQSDENIVFDLTNLPIGDNNTLYLNVSGVAKPFGIRLTPQ